MAELSRWGAPLSDDTDAARASRAARRRWPGYVEGLHDGTASRDGQQSDLTGGPSAVDACGRPSQGVGVQNSLDLRGSPDDRRDSPGRSERRIRRARTPGSRSRSVTF